MGTAARKAERKRERERARRLRRYAFYAAAGVAGMAVVVAAVFAFTGHDSGSKRRPVREAPVVTDARNVDVKVVDNDYEPRALSIKRGAEVSWTFDGDIPHTVTGDDFDSGVLQPGDTFNFTFDKTGTFNYYCTLHHVMEGSVTVTD